MAVEYQWLIEVVETESTEIVDHFGNDNAFDALKFLSENEPEPGTRYDFVVVRDKVNDVTTDVDFRAWAYIKDGVLPEVFLDADHRFGADMPKYVRQEYERAVKKLADRQSA